ncbi:MAG: type II toxin-antitoxin system VapC family toxin [Thioalkalivibrio sp.]|nr:type II toxin-antitoxin system VapC family toxin [Thioalkalivibrio sp.]
MSLLLDTHTFLWFINDDARLSRRAAAQIEDPSVRVVVSVVSAWEITIKLSIGKLVLDRALDRLWPDSIQANSFDELDVIARHIFTLGTLPLHHRDPFDRLLIAQARAENLTIVSADSAFEAYDVPRLWE